MLRQGEPVALPFERIDADNAAETALGYDFDSATGDFGVFIIPFKCQVVMACMVVTETCAGGTTTPVVNFDLRPTAGSDTDRGDGDIGSLALSTTAAGKMMFDEAGLGTLLTPGMEVVVELVTAAAGAGAQGHGRPLLLVDPIPETPANLSDMVETD